MNVREAHSLLVQHEKDLAAEPDDEVRAWYKVESELQPDISIARQTLAEVSAIAGLIEQVAKIKAVREIGVGDEGVSPDEVDAKEQPEVLTPDELLHKRIERKYAVCLRNYEAEIAVISTQKKSKREQQEKLARRNFARRFNDFSDVTGDEHIALRFDLLRFAADSVIENETLFDEVFLNCAEYTKRHAAEVTSSPKNFADLIAESVDGRPYSKDFEGILKSVFSTNPANFPVIQFNLAYAVFESLEDMDALETIVELAMLEKTYVPVEFHSQKLKHEVELLRNKDLVSLFDSDQIRVLHTLLNVDVTGQNYSPNSRQLQAIDRTEFKNTGAYQELLETLPAELTQALRAIELGTGINDFDPVEATSIDGEKVELGLQPIPETLRGPLEESTLFQVRMKQLAPYNYSIRLARQLLGSRGVHGLLIPLSPSLSVDVIFPMSAKQPPTVDEFNKLTERIYELQGEILHNATKSAEIGVKPYEKGGALGIAYQQLYEEDVRRGVVIYRPSIPLDKRTHSSLQQLLINYLAVRGIETFDGKTAFPENLEELLEKENQALRTAIQAEQKRFIGRRPIKFAMPLMLRQIAGLISVSMRYEPKQRRIICDFELDDGKVDLNLDRYLHIDDENTKLSLAYPGIRQYYENLILKLARKWTCSQEIYTSEGVVSEHSGNSANMGHFAYLRIRGTDGRRYRFTERQRIACLEEQGKDLAAESERLKYLDPTGSMRNSTYVRENYDPSKPPLVVHYSDTEQG